MRYIFMVLICLGLVTTASAKEPDEFDVEIKLHQDASEIFLKGEILNFSRNKDGRMETRIIYKNRYWICEDNPSFSLEAMHLYCASLNE